MGIYEKGYVIKYKVINNDYIDKLLGIANKHKHEAHTIFLNASHNEMDPKRSQFIIPEAYSALIKEISEVVKDVTFDLNLKWEVRSPTFLYSDAGGGIQQIHRDFSNTELSDLEYEELPASILIALSEGAKLLVYGWNRIEALKKEEKEIYLKAGDACVFLGNTIHAGASYTEKNIRLHCFLDVPGIEYQKNTTQPVVFTKFRKKV